MKTLEEAVVNIAYISLLPSADLNSSDMAPVRQVVFVLSRVVVIVLIYGESFPCHLESLRVSIPLFIQTIRHFLVKIKTPYCLQTFKVKAMSAPFVPFLRADQHPCQIQCGDD